MAIRSIDPKSLTVPELHGHLLGAINPRPVAFVATLDENGVANLAPFSFFNVFGANPPVVVFSPARRGKDNTTKDTYENIKISGECTVNIANYPLVHQMVLASTDYEKGVDEFEKAGFSKLESQLVKSPRVAECPVQFECKVIDIVNYGDLAGGGNLIIAEVVYLHINESVLGNDGKIDQVKMDTVGRCGKLWYTRTNTGLFSIENPKGNDNIGFDGMPASVRNSGILTGNDLGKLGKQNALPTPDEVAQFKSENVEIFKLADNEDRESKLHELAKQALENNEIAKAWLILLG